MELITLKAQRIRETQGIFKGYWKTLFYNPDGTFKCMFPAEQKQPHKNSKRITINSFKYAIDWMPDVDCETLFLQFEVGVCESEEEGTRSVFSCTELYRALLFMQSRTTIEQHPFIDLWIRHKPYMKLAALSASPVNLADNLLDENEKSLWVKLVVDPTLSFEEKDYIYQWFKEHSNPKNTLTAEEQNSEESDDEQDDDRIFGEEDMSAFAFKVWELSGCMEAHQVRELIQALVEQHEGDGSYETYVLPPMRKIATTMPQCNFGKLLENVRAKAIAHLDYLLSITPDIMLCEIEEDQQITEDMVQHLPEYDNNIDFHYLTEIAKDNDGKTIFWGVGRTDLEYGSCGIEEISTEHLCHIVDYLLPKKAD